MKDDDLVPDNNLTKEELEHFLTWNTARGKKLNIIARTAMYHIKELEVTGISEEDSPDDYGILAMERAVLYLYGLAMKNGWMDDNQ